MSCLMNATIKTYFIVPQLFSYNKVLPSMCCFDAAGRMERARWS